MDPLPGSSFALHARRPSPSNSLLCTVMLSDGSNSLMQISFQSDDESGFAVAGGGDADKYHVAEYLARVHGYLSSFMNTFRHHCPPLAQFCVHPHVWTSRVVTMTHVAQRRLRLTYAFNATSACAHVPRGACINAHLVFTSQAVRLVQRDAAMTGSHGNQVTDYHSAFPRRYGSTQ
ncbi:hypothetical protein MVEN_01631100 [Mycena venus]|uniref:Uncharacterized protein n=1 Tax=Mycena venus TaxID=2733690 RepID=A0A8H6XQM9_9AGAR|nr:hypothetical protein MVEN_01631100 [Mycena venus]